MHSRQFKPFPPLARVVGIQRLRPLKQAARNPCAQQMQALAHPAALPVQLQQQIRNHRAQDLQFHRVGAAA